jgi:hypothetical protein
MTALSERTMLTALHLGAWSGNAVDRQVTEEVSESHKADIQDAGRYSKRLASPKFFRDVNAAYSLGRQTHRVLTLPWSDDGTRILSTLGYQHYTEQMRLIRLKADAAIRQFSAQYDDIKREAKVRLGTMFDGSEYPEPETVLKKFYFDVEIKPTPEKGDFRAQLADNTVKAITKDIERRTNARIEAAVADIYQRVYDSVNKMAKKLAEYDPSTKDGAFRDSLVYNINALADLIPSLNITGDPKLNDLATRLKRDLVEHSPEILRADTKARSETQRKAEALAKRAKAFLGV